MGRRNGFRALVNDEKGGTAIEYGMICACIVIAMIVALKNVAATNTKMWNNVADQVTGASTTGV